MIKKRRKIRRKEFDCSDGLEAICRMLDIIRKEFGPFSPIDMRIIFDSNAVVDWLPTPYQYTRNEWGKLLRNGGPMQRDYKIEDINKANCISIISESFQGRYYSQERKVVYCF